MKHYYTDNTDLISEPVVFQYDYQGHILNFTSDHGVFSKAMIDYGSRVLLDAITVDETKKTLLDVGCGYGTFGICLKTVYPWLKMEMVDVNDRALDLCRKNAEANNIQDVAIYKSYIYDNVEKSFDLIVSNPPIRAGKEVVHQILEKAYNHLNIDGELWIVIQKKQGAPSAKSKMNEVFGNCEVVKKDKGYYILKSKKE